MGADLSVHSYNNSSRISLCSHLQSIGCITFRRKWMRGKEEKQTCRHITDAYHSFTHTKRIEAANTKSNKAKCFPFTANSCVLVVFFFCWNSSTFFEYTQWAYWQKNHCLVLDRFMANQQEVYAKARESSYKVFFIQIFLSDRIRPHETHSKIEEYALDQTEGERKQQLSEFFRQMIDHTITDATWSMVNLRLATLIYLNL